MVPRLQEELKGSLVPDRVVAMQAIKRPGVASDIEGTISFPSADAVWITGQSITADGSDTRH
jgi:NAD(P)-dependent dehydrogenase (short-subunit alcohol dehydrogenase family)